jgi:hypothetical protein
VRSAQVHYDRATALAPHSGRPDQKGRIEMASARAELIDALARDIGVPPLTPSEIESVLALAAVAAHGTGDRTTAPLASFLAGLAAAAAEDRVAALDETRRRVAELAPAAESS